MSDGRTKNFSLFIFNFSLSFFIMSKFSRLHVHTQFSLLDGVTSIKSLYQKAIDDDMPALAITDHGNMFGLLNLWPKLTDTLLKLFVSAPWIMS